MAVQELEATEGGIDFVPEGKVGVVPDVVLDCAPEVLDGVEAGRVGGQREQGAAFVLLERAQLFLAVEGGAVQDDDLPQLLESV